MARQERFFYSHPSFFTFPWDSFFAGGGRTLCACLTLFWPRMSENLKNRPTAVEQIGPNEEKTHRTKSGMSAEQIVVLRPLCFQLGESCTRGIYNPTLLSCVGPSVGLYCSRSCVWNKICFYWCFSLVVEESFSLKLPHSAFVSSHDYEFILLHYLTRRNICRVTSKQDWNRVIWQTHILSGFCVRCHTISRVCVVLSFSFKGARRLIWWAAPFVQFLLDVVVEALSCFGNDHTSHCSETS